MKDLVLTGIFCFICGAVIGQTFDEWFKQKKTQIKYLKEQIAALKAYQVVLEDGYKIAKGELENIVSVKQSDLDQHTGYINSLQTAKVRVKDDPRVQAALNLSHRIVGIGATIQQVVRSAAQPSFEMLSFADYMVRETNQADEDVQDMLADIIYGKGFLFSDDQRLGLLDHLYKGVQLNYRNAINVLRRTNELLNQPAQ